MADLLESQSPQPQRLCASADLQEGALAVPFDVLDVDEAADEALPIRAFAIRFEGRVHAYLNRCNHVAMEMDWQPNRFFDDSGQWLLCASHGAAYLPDSGACAGGPCQGGLVKIPVSETGGQVHWYPVPGIAPLQF